MKRIPDAWAIWAACILLAASLLGKLSYLHTATRGGPAAVEPGAARKEHTAALWDVARAPVHLQFDHYQRYALDAAPQWAALVPHGGLVVVAGRPYTLAMFHQLRCLDVLRAQLRVPRAQRDMPRARHCMNYLRQMALCRGDMHLETFHADRWSPENVDRRGTYRCRDFRAVYDAVEGNWREHAAGANATAMG